MHSTTVLTSGGHKEQRITLTFPYTLKGQSLAYLLSLSGFTVITSL